MKTKKHPAFIVFVAITLIFIQKTNAEFVVMDAPPPKPIVLSSDWSNYSKIKGDFDVFNFKDSFSTCSNKAAFLYFSNPKTTGKLKKNKNKDSFVFKGYDFLEYETVLSLKLTEDKMCAIEAKFDSVRADQLNSYCKPQADRIIGVLTKKYGTPTLYPFPNKTEIKQGEYDFLATWDLSDKTIQVCLYNKESRYQVVFIMFNKELFKQIENAKMVKRSMTSSPLFFQANRLDSVDSAAQALRTSAELTYWSLGLTASGLGVLYLQLKSVSKPSTPSNLTIPYMFFTVGAICGVLAPYYSWKAGKYLSIYTQQAFNLDYYQDGVKASYSMKF